MGADKKNFACRKDNARILVDALSEAQLPCKLFVIKSFKERLQRKK